MKRVAEAKAQEEADDIEQMLAHAAVLPLGRISPKGTPSLVNSRVPSNKSLLDNDSQHQSTSSSSSLKERTDYGLSKEILSMLVTGSTFHVTNFLGLKGPKFFFVTTDIASIGSRSNKGNHVTLIPFEKFES